MPGKKKDQKDAIIENAEELKKIKIKLETMPDKTVPGIEVISPLIKTDRELLKDILNLNDELNNIRDVDELLDFVLFKVCKYINAEGGTIFLEEESKLKIAYVNNAPLFKKDPANKYKYLDHEVALTEDSIAGFCAVTGQSVIIDDAYKLPAGTRYGFNGSFDKMSGYKTQSVIAVPLKTSMKKVIGVLQIINAKDEKGKTIPFNNDNLLFVQYLANAAASAIEKTKMTRQMILRTIKMVEFRDPKETGAHVHRMSTYSVEIYNEYAKDRSTPLLIRRYKDKLRIASMMHDIGKIAISDKILKKPGKLDNEEFNEMKKHTVHGAVFFEDGDSELDYMSAQIALNHHEKWDGSGYPGYELNEAFSIKDPENIRMNPGKHTEKIPIEARIVALADVYDALISKRVYKDAWEEGHVLDYFKENSGKHFDPEVVKCFFNIYGTIRQIKEKYQDEEAAE